MTRPIPPEILARIDAHELWLQTFKREGHAFSEGKVDLHDLDLSGRHFSMITLPEVNLDRSVLRGTNMSDAIFTASSFVQAVLDNARLIKTDASEANLPRRACEG